MNDTLKSVLKTTLPWIGTALGGPLGTGVASFIAGQLDVAPEAVEEKLAGMLGNPIDRAKLKELETQVQMHLATLGYQSIKDIAEIEFKTTEVINQTMQAESKAEHWMQYSWRPFNGFLCGITIFGTYFVLPLIKITPPNIPESVWLMWGAILGVASFFRGKMQADPAIPTATKIAPQPSIASKISQKLVPSTTPTITQGE